ncbi:MAG: glycosyl hydrolase family 18 protein [Rikenellaceae bacterium]
MKRYIYRLSICTVALISLLITSCDDYTGPENKLDLDTEQDPDDEDVGYPEPYDYDFISQAYFSLMLAGVDEYDVEYNNALLDNYRWEGISDVVLIKEMFVAGIDGSLCHEWNSDEWPMTIEEVGTEWASAWNGGGWAEATKRSQLCSREVIEGLVHYFKKKGIRVHISLGHYEWENPGSEGYCLLDDELTAKLGANLREFASSIGVEYLDFDIEFPTTTKMCENYVSLIQGCKDAGFHTSMCVIDPYENWTGGDDLNFPEIIANKTIDTFNTMQYLGNSGIVPTSSDRVSVMNLWKYKYPEIFDTESTKAEVGALMGVGFYGQRLTGYSSLATASNPNFPTLYNSYGMTALSDGNIAGDYGVFTTDEVYKVVWAAKNMGCRGVMTWLVTHDFDKTFPDKYSRQYALATAVQEIWAAEDANKE